MQHASFDIPDIKVLTPKRFFDDRGMFSESYNKKLLQEHGIVVEFVQDNHSLSKRAGTVRGLHFQTPPFAQDKLIRVVRGRILDVAVDIRQGSPTFGRVASAEISSEAWNQIFVPKGFAHGFCTLEDDTEVIYKTSDYYAREHERGILWNDRDLKIVWPVADDCAILSERDRQLPTLKASPDLFVYAVPE